MSSAQDRVEFSRLSLAQGLSQSTVHAVVQDRDGFLWIGTQDGLNLYDGTSVRVFRFDPTDTMSLSENGIRALLVDRTGTLWVGTVGGGLNRFLPGSERFVRYRAGRRDSSSLPGNIVSALYEDRAGVVWVGTDGGGLCRRDPKSGAFRVYSHDPANPFSISDNTVTAFFELPNGVLLVGTRRGGLCLFDRSTERFVPFVHRGANPGNIQTYNVTAICADSGGGVWIGVEGYGVLWFADLQNPDAPFAVYRHDPRLPRSIGSNNPTALFQDKSGRLWVGTSDAGVDLLDPAHKTFRHFRNTPDDPASLSIDLVNVLLEDRSGTLWIGTDGGGLNSFHPARTKFGVTPFDRDCAGKTKNLVVMALQMRGESELLVGTDGAGVQRFLIHDQGVERRGGITAVSAGLSDNFISALLEDRSGNLWIGTTYGLNLLAQGQRVVQSYYHRADRPHSLSDDHVTCLYQDRSGVLWIGTGGGVNRFDPVGKQFVHFTHDDRNDNSLISNRVQALLESSSGDLWIGTMAGLDRLDSSRTVIRHFLHDPRQPTSLSSGAVISLYEDRAGRLWVGTRGGGLNLLEGNGGFRRYTVRDGLPNDVVYATTEDSDGNLWFSTNRGLCRFTPSTGTFRAYDVEDGLPSNEFNSRAFIRASGGRLFAGSINGVCTFNPGSLRDNPFPPNVVLSTFRLFDDAKYRSGELAAMQDILLQYDQNFLSFEMAVLDFVAPQKNRCTFLLEGLDASWSPPTTARSAAYKAIEPGTYTFRYKGSNSDGVWSREQQIRLTVRPPFWETLWFRALVVLALAGSALAVHRYRLARLLEVERMRLRIASDLHDEIGSNLSSIALLSDLVQAQRPEMEEGRQELTTIGRTARTTADALREIVWIINPTHDRTDNLILRMKDIAGSLLPRLQFSIDSPDTGGSARLDMNVRRHLLLMYKETLNNIVKHSRATEVAIAIRDEHHEFGFTVKDNGIGFDEETVKKGNGLANLRARAGQVGGSVSITSSPGKGCAVSVRVKIP